MGVYATEGKVQSPFATLSAALKALRDNPDPDRREVLDGIVSHYRAYLGVAWEREAKKHKVTACRRCGQSLTKQDSIDLWLVDGLGVACRRREDEERAA